MMNNDWFTAETQSTRGRVTRQHDIRRYQLKISGILCALRGSAVIRLAGALGLILAVAGPSAAAVDDAILRIDPVTVEAPDRSAEPLAGWDDVGLGDNARDLLRVPDRAILRLASGHDERGRAPFAPRPFPYDTLDDSKLQKPLPEHNTLRNFLILMFLTGDN